MLNVYSKAKNGTVKVGAHFKVSEFACKDGSDTVFIDTELIEVLEKIRAHFNKPIRVNSGYRTEQYNKKIGGATYSQHKYGKAADIAISGVDPTTVYNIACEILGNKGGCGKYKTFTHVDVRETKSRW